MGSIKRFSTLFFLIVVMGFIIAAIGIAQEKKQPTPSKPVEKKAVVSKPPIGKPRTDREFSKDIEELLFSRRVAISDLPGGIAFKAKDCMRCHENEPGVEGQIFYGNPDFEKDVNWPDYIAHPERKHAPSLQYNFSETHKRKVKLTPRGNMEQFMKQNQ